MEYLQKARRVLQIEISELQRLADRLDERFEKAVRLLLETVEAGRKIIVIGVRENRGDAHQHWIARLRSQPSERLTRRSWDRGRRGRCHRNQLQR